MNKINVGMITNVVKHANAKNLTVKLAFVEGKVTLAVHVIRPKYKLILGRLRWWE